MGHIAKTLVLSGTSVLAGGTASGQGCPGDMNGDRNVSVSELVTAVTSALDGCPFPPEPGFVDNRNGTITDRTISPFDVDNDAAIATRHRVFGEYADSPTLIIGTHFAGPTAGKLVRDGDTYRLDV